MNLSWSKIKTPIIGLSPMADMTDSPFCQVVKKLSKQTIIFREMVSADAIVHSNPKTLKMIEFQKSEKPFVQQIFGRDPIIMAEAAQIISELHHPDFIDLNMGCPARKLTNSFHGCALMQDPILASKIIQAVKNKVKIPISVKTRTGWQDEKEILTFAPALEQAGADLITIHGRTKKQAYKGSANWEIIRQVKEKISIPILANGDITTPELAQKALEITKADGILIARGSLGNPWIFSQIENYLKNNHYSQPKKEELIKIVLLHATLHIEHYGPDSLVTFRKHLVNYFKGLPGIKKIRQQLVKIKTIKELKEILKQL